MPPSSRRGGKRGTDRVTPYSTNQRRQRGSSPDFLPNHSPTSDQLNVVELLLSKSWRLYRVSPLWHFETSSTKLRSYCTQLNRHLLVTPSLESGCSSKLTPLPRFGLDGSAALKINIQKRNSQQDSSEAVIILCRVKPPQLSPGEGFASMPLLLSQGPLALVEPVLRWLAATFDCFVSPFSLNQEDLLILASHYANTEPEGKSQGNIELVYSTPPSVKKAGLSSVAVELPRESVETVWNVASKKVKGDGGDGKVKEVFLEMIGDVVSRGTSIQVKSFTLTRISTPALHADASGFLKFLSHGVPIPVLSVLQSSWTNN